MQNPRSVASTTGPAAYNGFHLRAMDSHGDWVMTSADMVRFADAVDGRSGVPALLSPATIQRMTTRDPKVEGTKYGLGWELNLPGWGHGGALTTGTHSQLEHRDDGVTWAVVYNSLPADPERGFQGLLDTAAISIDGVRAAVISCTQGR